MACHRVSVKASYIIPTHNRKDELVEAIESIRNQNYDDQEIIIISDRSTDGTRDLFTSGGRLDDAETKFYHSEERIGAPEARNIGIDMASGEVLMFVDDDIVLPDDDATTSIVQGFETEDELGVLALCIENYYTGEIMSDEFPHRSKEPTRRSAFETTYFIGAGCAIRATALQEAGGFPESFDPNRFEEIDLSFRILDAGYTIRFEPSVVVRHKRSPKGRKLPTELVRYDLENRIKASVRNLPWRHVLVSTVLWGLFTLLRSRFDPRPVFRALLSIWQSRAMLLEERSVLAPETVERVKEHSGRLYY